MNRGNIAGLRCVKCASFYSEAEAATTCPRCGLEGILDVEYDWQRIRWHPSLGRSLWRYLPMLPVDGTRGLPSIQVGWTPLAEFPELAAREGLGSLVIKDEARQPSGSFKDRASAVGAVRAREQGASTIACASTGNAAVSLACFAANLGMKAVIFVPKSAPEAKVAQLRAFGAVVLLVEGTYADAWKLCQDAVAELGWYNRNCAVNPYLVEGKKTCGLELGEQLASRPPDWVAVSVGDGCTIAGIWKGLQEMHRLGVLPRLPRLLGVQAQGARPLVDAFDAKANEVVFGPSQTIADSINVGEPRNWRKALRAVRQSEGAFIAVPDSAILEAARDLPAATGIFAEPTSAASLAGIRAAVARKLMGPRDRVVYVSTGTGLKDVRGATQLSPPAITIAPALADVRKAVEGRL